MQSNVNVLSIAFFFVFMGLTLFITYWAAKRTSTTEHFFAAGGQITAWQNGWALAGDFLSAAALLGIAGIITSNGFDGMIYSIGWLVGWPIILFLIVEPLRNVGKFTFADVVAYRLGQRSVRSSAAIGTLAVILFYLIAQMVATGSLIKLLFGVPYAWSVLLVGSVMLIYVLFGGMRAREDEHFLLAIGRKTVGDARGELGGQAVSACRERCKGVAHHDAARFFQLQPPFGAGSGPE